MPEPSTQVRAPSARMVKIVNHGNQDYVEEFRGDIWTIPANGYVVRPVMEANRFVGQFKRPLKKVNGQWVHVPGPKPLEMTELTPKDREKIEGITDEDQKVAEKKAEEKMGLSCMKCGFVANSSKGLKVHVSAIHPEEVEEDDT